MDLTDQLKSYISRNGAMPVNEFMRKAMSQDKGYYKNQLAIGSDADFITSPEISQLFGEIIGVWAALSWQENLNNEKFNLVEMGPGKATLMSDLLRATKNIELFHSKLNLYLLEINNSLKKIQQTKLEKSKPKWLNDYTQIKEDKTIFIANEFFDVLPVIQYVKRKKSWYELMVDLKENSNILHFVDKPIDQITQNMLREEYSHVPIDGVIEICYEAKKIMRHICSIIKSQGGSAIIIDYGFTEQDRNIKSYISTLQGIKSHKFSNIFENIGETDLTTQVNFSDLTQSARISGCKTTYMTQREFLLKYGIEIRKSLLLKQSPASKHSDIISGYHRLIDQDKMGNLFKVLLIENS